jgi:hypothetical protein
MICKREMNFIKCHSFQSIQHRFSYKYNFWRWCQLQDRSTIWISLKNSLALTPYLWIQSRITINTSALLKSIWQYCETYVLPFLKLTISFYHRTHLYLGYQQYFWLFLSNVYVEFYHFFYGAPIYATNSIRLDQ